MNTLLGLVVLAIGSAVAVPPAPAVPPVTVSCDVELNVTDPDPNGLNVRIAPSAKSAKVTALKPVGDWVQVHVTGQRGDWFRIDHADAIDDSAEDGLRKLFNGEGWVHQSKLGVSELYVGDGTTIRDRPMREGAVLLQIDTPEKEPNATRVIGCEASYIKVEIDGRTGWTNRWCNNERTTCS